MNKDHNIEKQIEEMARSFCGLSATLKCSECSYECFQKEYARKAFEAGYRKASDVAREIFSIIDDVVESWKIEVRSKEDKMTQRDIILWHLQNVGTLTRAQAMSEYGIL